MITSSSKRPLHRPYIPDGCDQQGRITPTHAAPAEAATDIGFENEPAPRRKCRLGAIGPVHRLLLRRTPVFNVAITVLIAAGCAVWMVLR